MINPKKLEQLAKQVQESLPKSIRDLGDDVEKKIRQALQNQFNRIDLVSREEFDLQTQVLLSTQKKLNQLELRLNTLETMLKSNSIVNLAMSADSVVLTSEDEVVVKKPAGVHDVGDTISVSPVDNSIALDSDITDDTSAQGTFKKL